MFLDRDNMDFGKMSVNRVRGRVDPKSSLSKRGVAPIFSQSVSEPNGKSRQVNGTGFLGEILWDGGFARYKIDAFLGARP